MARQPRFVLPGHPQHVIQRGNNRQSTFFADEDYHFYLNCLKDAVQRYRCAVHAYVLMTNHVHLLMSPSDKEGISRTLQHVGRLYVRYINHMYRRSGTLWEGRYKATLVDSERYLLTCYRYIELNPVRTNMATHPGGYPWSSYGAHAMGKNNFLLQDHALYIALGRTPNIRQTAYRALFKGHIDENTLAKIRHSTNKGWVLGDSMFKAEIEAALERRVTPLPKGGDRRSKEYLAKNS